MILKNKKKLGTGFLLVAFLCLAFYFFLSPAQGDSEKAASEDRQGAAAVKVKVLHVQSAPMKDTLVLPGQTYADGDVILSAEINGRAEWIGPEEGDIVKKDQEIIKIDAKTLKARLDNATATLRLAEDQARRRKKLFKQGVVSEEELDSILTARTQAMAAAMEARINYSKGVIASPLDGVVDNLYIDEGEYVTEGTALVQIVDRDKVRVHINVSEQDIRYIKMGQPAVVTIDAWGNKKWQGKVTYIAAQATSSTRTFRVRIMVENKDKVIHPGMMARVAIERRTALKALSVPLSAVLNRGGEQVIFVEENGIAKRRVVGLGILQKDSIEIVSGLKEGENCIIKGQTELNHGMRVEVQ